LLLALVTAAGCGSGGGAPASFTATWTINVAGTPVNCDALSSETVEVIFTRRSTQVSDTFLFNCADGLGRRVISSPELVQDLYDVTISLWNNYDDMQNRLLLATRTISVGLVGNISDLPLFAFTPSFGAFDLAWTITDAGSASTCGAVGADTFEWTITNVANSNVDTFLFTCTDMAALTNNPPVPFGTYNVRARLKGGSQTLGEASASGLVLNQASLLVPSFAFSF
jgi:hypothetical protein